MWCHWHRIFVFNSRSYDVINDGIVSSTANTRHIQRDMQNMPILIGIEKYVWVIFDIEHLYSTADLMMPSMTLSSSDTVRNDLRVLYILFQVHMYFHKGNCLHKYQCLFKFIH